MEVQQNNQVLEAINAVISTFKQQIVEQATKPLVERIVRLEQQNNELYDIIGISLKGHVNNTVNISMAAVKQDIIKQVLDTVRIEVLKANVLNEVNTKIEAAIRSIPAGHITGLMDAFDESLQNQPPLDAGDINGLKNFVRDVVNGVYGEGVEANDIDGLDKFVRDIIDDVSEEDDSVTEKVKEALRAAADSI